MAKDREGTLQTAVARALRSIAGWLSGEGDLPQIDDGCLQTGDSGEFQRLLTEAPIETHADRKILARMLVEILVAGLSDRISVGETSSTPSGPQMTALGSPISMSSGSPNLETSWMRAPLASPKV